MLVDGFSQDFGVGYTSKIDEQDETCALKSTLDDFSAIEMGFCN